MMKGGHDVLSHGRLAVPVEFAVRGEADRLHPQQCLGQRAVGGGDLSGAQSRA